MHFLKEHLAGHHYYWNTISDTTAFTGTPGRRLFDPFNGQQVLYIINYFGQSIGILTEEAGRTLEEMMLKQLPEEVKSEVAVFNWLRVQYLYHSN